MGNRKREDGLLTAGILDHFMTSFAHSPPDFALSSSRATQRNATTPTATTTTVRGSAINDLPD